MVSEDVLERLGDRSGQTAALRRMAELCAELDDPTCTVTTLLGESRRAFEASDYGVAVDLAVRASGLARDSGLPERVAEGHLWAGKALTWHGRGAEAREQLDTALTLARAQDRTPVVAETLRYLAMLASNEGRFDEALERGLAARAEFVKDGDVEAENTALAQHAVTLFNLGRVEESRDLFEQVLPVFAASGHLYRQAIVLGNLASSAFLLGDLSAAERWCRQALERTDTLEDAEGGATNRTVLGLIELWTGRWSAARPHLESSWRTGLEVEADIVALDAATWLGLGMLEYGEPLDVVVAHTRSVAADAGVDTVGPQHAGQAQLAHAYALAATGDTEQLDGADAAASRAADILTGSGVDAAVPQCAVLRLSIARARGLDPAEAAMRAAALVDRLDRQAVAVSVRPPTVLADLWEALAAGGAEHDGARRRLRDTARAFVHRRMAGAEETETRAGFLGVHSVARLVRLLDAS